MDLKSAAKKIMDALMEPLKQEYPGIHYSIHQYHENKQPTVEVWGSDSKAQGTYFNFRMTGFPGCQYIITFHDVYCNPQGKGLGQELLLARLAIAKEAGYSLATATTETTNTVENHILFKHGFRVRDVFPGYNNKTAFYLWSKVIE